MQRDTAAMNESFGLTHVMRLLAAEAGRVGRPRPRHPGCLRAWRFLEGITRGNAPDINEAVITRLDDVKRIMRELEKW